MYLYIPPIHLLLLINIIMNINELKIYRHEINSMANGEMCSLLHS